jgi:hypothetical protein
VLKHLFPCFTQTTWPWQVWSRLKALYLNEAQMPMYAALQIIRPIANPGYLLNLDIRLYLLTMAGLTVNLDCPFPSCHCFRSSITVSGLPLLRAPHAAPAPLFSRCRPLVTASKKRNLRPLRKLPRKHPPIDGSLHGFSFHISFPSYISLSIFHHLGEHLLWCWCIRQK